MLLRPKSFVKRMLTLFPRWQCRRDFERQTITRLNERPVELKFVFSVLAETYPKSVLDVGTGTTALPSLMRCCGYHTTAIDNIRDYWPAGMINLHYHVIDDDITKTQLKGGYDAITCISVLEHIERYDKAVANMFRLLNENGRLLMTFPYTDKTFVDNVYELPGATLGQNAPYKTHSFCRENLDRWLRENNGILVRQEFWQFWEGDFWSVGNQIIPPRQVSQNELQQLTCLLMQKA